MEKTEKPFMDADDFGKALEEVMGNTMSEE